MLKKNLGVLADLLMTLLLGSFVEVGIASLITETGKRMILILICHYLVILPFVLRCFRVVWKSEHIKNCIGALILGVLIFGNGIYNLITYDSWLDSTFIICTMYSMSIFLGALFNVIKKN